MLNLFSKKTIQITGIQLLLLTACIQTYGFDFGVDFGPSSQTMESYDSMTLPAGELGPGQPDSFTQIFSSSLGQSGNLNVELQWVSGANGVAAFDDSASLDSGHPLYNLLVDSVGNNGAFSLKLHDLKAGIYSITTYHNDAGLRRNPIAIKIRDADNQLSCYNWREIPVVYQSKAANASDPLTKAQFAFKADGTETYGIEIRFENIGGPADVDGPVLNAFELNLLESDTKWIKIDLGPEDQDVANGYLALTGPYKEPKIFDTNSCVTAPSSYGTSGNIDICLTNAGFEQSTLAMDPNDPFEDLLDDYAQGGHILNFWGSMYITLDGLKAGTYQILTYHNEPEIPLRPGFEVFINEERIIEQAGQSQLTSTTNTCLKKLAIPFVVNSDNDNVSILFVALDKGNLSYSAGGLVAINLLQLSKWVLYSQELCGDSGIFLGGDLDKNCRVDISDMILFSNTWMQCTNPVDASCN